mgnify:CR=1 FL=1
MSSLWNVASVLALSLAVSPAYAQTPEKPAPASDLDAFMERVLARRDANRKTLNDYILDEKEDVANRFSTFASVEMDCPGEIAFIFFKKFQHRHRLGVALDAAFSETGEFFENQSRVSAQREQRWIGPEADPPSARFARGTFTPSRRGGLGCRQGSKVLKQTVGVLVGGGMFIRRTLEQSFDSVASSKDNFQKLRR